MAKAQLACDNSQTYITMRLVHAAEVAYTESTNANTDLYHLTYTDGVMDNVHTLRTTYGADLVVLLEFTDTTGGIGWLLSTVSGSASYGFSISRVQQASWTYTTTMRSDITWGLTTINSRPPSRVPDSTPIPLAGGGPTTPAITAI